MWLAGNTNHRGKLLKISTIIGHKREIKEDTTFSILRYSRDIKLDYLVSITISA
jgi:hypothetical protein